MAASQVPRPPQSGLCNCIADTLSLVDGMPTAAEVLFEDVLNYGQKVNKTWRSVSRCRCSYLDFEVVRVLTGAVERLLTLHGAGAVTYGRTTSRQPMQFVGACSLATQRASTGRNGRSPTQTVIRSSVVMDNVCLEDEEADHLIGMILSDALANISSLLNSLRERVREGQRCFGYPVSQPNAAEMEAYIDRTCAQLDALLGEVRLESI